MAITVKTGGTFPTGQDGQRPGLYVRFIDKAIAAIGIGSRSKVATLKQNFTGGTAVKDTVYRITNLEQAATIFGTDNVADIQNILMGGASEVVVVAADPAANTSAAFATPLGILETYEFHVFKCPVQAALETQVFTWTKSNRDNGKNFISVFAGTDTEVVADMKTKAATFKDENCVFVGNGVKDGYGNVINADMYAAYIAGLIAGTPLDGSLTYFQVPYADVKTRFRAPDVQDLLASNILLTVMDGDDVIIEQGLTQGTGQFEKIRTVRAKQAMIDDINKAVNDNYIGKITNNPDGQIAVINAIKAYLGTLAGANVIDKKFTVELDKVTPSVGSELYINIGVKFLDSIEYVFLTITI